MRHDINASIFIDAAAEVRNDDDEEEEEDDEEEEGDSDLTELDVEDETEYSSRSTLITRLLNDEKELEEEEHFSDFIERARKNALEWNRHGERSEDSSGQNCLFCVQVARGKEEEIVLRLFRKSIVTRNRSLFSIFSVPIAPGRVYVEADSLDSVRRLCTGMNFVYVSSMFLVPVAERVALMEARHVKPRFEVGSFVIIRNGLYEGDRGEVISSSNNGDWLGVKLRSREPLPEEVVGKRKRSSKRKRCEPYILPKDHIQRQDPNNFESTEKGFFLHLEKKYTFDGYRLLDIRHDRVSPAKEPTIPTSFTNIRGPFQNSPSLLKDGDRVEVAAGPYRSNPGTILQIESRIALVQFYSKSIAEHESRMEFDVQDLKLTFAIGDSVEVKMGDLTGQTGFVVSINDDALRTSNTELVNKDTLTIVNMEGRNEFEVPSAYVGSYTPYNSTPQDAIELSSNTPIIVTSGKHAGKSGRVSSMHHSWVRMVEDITLIKLDIHRDAVKYRMGAPVKIKYGKHQGRKGFVVYENRFDATVIIDSETSNEVRVNRCWLEYDHESPIMSPYTVRNLEIKAADLKPLTGPGCKVDHNMKDFVGQRVYVWHGPLKGKIGIVREMSGGAARVHFDAALQHSAIKFVQANFLLARCKCLLGPGLKPTWSKAEIEQIPFLFEDTHPPVTSCITNVPSNDRMRSARQPHDSQALTLDKEFHDPLDAGFWLFDPKISALRRSNVFVVKIDAHPDPDIAGRHIGRVQKDDQPLTIPLRKSTPAKVSVEYEIRGEKRTELISVVGLRTTRLSTKGRHAVISGDRIGQVVIHKKTEGPLAQVYVEGTHKTKDAFRIEVDKLCVIEQ